MKWLQYIFVQSFLRGKYLLQCANILGKLLVLPRFVLHQLFQLFFTATDPSAVSAVLHYNWSISCSTPVVLQAFLHFTSCSSFVSCSLTTAVLHFRQLFLIQLSHQHLFTLSPSLVVHYSYFISWSFYVANLYRWPHADVISGVRGRVTHIFL